MNLHSCEEGKYCVNTLGYYDCVGDKTKSILTGNYRILLSVLVAIDDQSMIFLCGVCRGWFRFWCLSLSWWSLVVEKGSYKEKDGNKEEEVL